MKQMLILMVLLAGLAGALYLTVGGFVLALVVATAALTTIILAAFAVGSWWTHRVMQTGARLSNEALDSRLPVAILQAGRAAAMYRGEGRGDREALPQRKPATYPMLPAGFVEGEFEIAGLEGEQKDEETVP